MAKITGRSDDTLFIRGVNVFPTQIEELIHKHKELSPPLRDGSEQRWPLTHLTVMVELGKAKRVIDKRRK